MVFKRKIFENTKTLKETIMELIDFSYKKALKMEKQKKNIEKEL